MSEVRMAYADSNQDAITNLYQTILGRQPDAGGLEFWTNALNNGTSLDQIRQSFANSDEAKGLVNKAYQQFLFRDAEPAGMAYYTDYLGTGGTLQQVRDVIANSPEAQSVIEKTEKIVSAAKFPQVEPASSAAEGEAAKDASAGTLLGNATSLVTAPVVSSNNQDSITKLYQEILSRYPETAGLEYWTKALENGASLDQIRQAIAHSDEAKAFVDQLYVEFLHRHAEPAGLANYTDYLGNGGTIQKVREAIAYSPEGRAIAEQAARTFGLRKVASETEPQTVNLQQAMQEVARQTFSPILQHNAEVAAAASSNPEVKCWSSRFGTYLPVGYQYTGEKTTQDSTKSFQIKGTCMPNGNILAEQMDRSVQTKPALINPLGKSCEYLYQGGKLTIGPTEIRPFTDSLGQNWVLFCGSSSDPRGANTMTVWKLAH